MGKLRAAPFRDGAFHGDLHDERTLIAGRHRTWHRVRYRLRDRPHRSSVAASAVLPPRRTRPVWINRFRQGLHVATGNTPEWRSAFGRPRLPGTVCSCHPTSRTTPICPSGSRPADRTRRDARPHRLRAVLGWQAAAACPDETVGRRCYVRGRRYVPRRAARVAAGGTRPQSGRASPRIRAQHRGRRPSCDRDDDCRGRPDRAGTRRAASPRARPGSAARGRRRPRKDPPPTARQSPL